MLKFIRPVVISGAKCAFLLIVNVLNLPTLLFIMEMFKVKDVAQDPELFVIFLLPLLVTFVVKFGGFVLLLNLCN